MSGAARARNKTRPRRGPGPIRSADEADTARSGAAPDPVLYPYETRGSVPAPRPVPALEPALAGHGGARTAGTVDQGTAASSASAGESQIPGPSDGFARGYAAPADAVRCAMLGSPPTFWFEGDAGRLTIEVDAGRLVADGVVHIGEDLAQLVAAVLLNHEGETADAVEPVRAALAELATLAGHGGAEVTVDLSGPSPRLGWLSRFDPAPWVTWHDWWSAFAASPAARTAAAVAGAGDCDDVDDCFARQGLRVVRCAEPGCAAPLTDRHPTWTGVWSSASGALGPVCAVSAEAQAWPVGLLSALPHRVAEA
jgi:hypothetical protein